jgi:hypothetical protein
MSNALATLFFRLYAANLRRSWRNNPKDAWSDSILTMDSLIAVPVLSTIMVFWTISVHLFPNSIGVLGMPKGVGLIVVVMVSFVVDAWFTSSINRHKHDLITPDSFAAPRDRMAIVIAFAISFLFAVAMVGIIVLLRR